MVNALFKVLLFGLPSFAYVHLQHRQGRPRPEALAELGLRPSRPQDYLWALAVLVGTGALGALAVSAVPADVLADPRTGAVLQGAVARGPLAALAVGLSALAEELLFRGYLMMLLARRFSFPVMNAVQAVTFAGAHLVLLLIGVSLWPLLLVHLVGGWLLGWLRARSGTIVPGFLAHMVLGLTVMAAYAA